ncbi:MAG: hypothetical protein MZU95_13480 [Desulfomicrobium escambiense]|nr:hypothetical protein [Desulfomicrobium escambiense]
MLPFGRLDAMFHAAQLRCSVAGGGGLRRRHLRPGPARVRRRSPARLPSGPRLKALAVRGALRGPPRARVGLGLRRLPPALRPRRSTAASISLSNLSFAAPVLIPWAADVGRARPGPRAALARRRPAGWRRPRGRSPST